MNIDEQAKALFERTAKAHGWPNPTPWEELHDSTRQFYRAEVVRRAEQWAARHAQVQAPFCAFNEGKLWIETTIEDEKTGRISQEVIHELDGMRRAIIRNVINLQEVGIRQALMKLGWTPPPVSATGGA